MGGQIGLVLVAIAGGIAITVQGQMMGVIDRQLGTLESLFLTYALGGVAAALVILAVRGGNLGQWQQLPWWSLTSGLFGLVIVTSIGFSVARLGAVSAFTLIIAAQFVVSLLIDHFGLLGAEVRSINWQKLTGIATLLLGVWLTVR